MSYFVILSNILVHTVHCRIHISGDSRFYYKKYKLGSPPLPIVFLIKFNSLVKYRVFQVFELDLTK